MAGRIIATDACVAEGVAWLAAQDPVLALAIDLCGPLPLRRHPDGFAALLLVIVGQQVSVASAEATWVRMQTAGLTEPVAIILAGDADLRAVGLSRQKARYARALAQAGIDFDALRLAPEATVLATLTAVPGIGRWTAEIYAMFALGRADAFAPGDLALQEAVRVLFTLDNRPNEATLRNMAVAWSPWRSVAARVLWAYYARMKSKEGVLG